MLKYAPSKAEWLMAISSDRPVAILCDSHLAENEKGLPHPVVGVGSHSVWVPFPLGRFLSMRQLLNLWNDERGYLLSAESVFLATILVIGLVAGWKSVNQAVNNELEDVGKAISSLDQTYSFCGTTGCCTTPTARRSLMSRGTTASTPASAPRKKPKPATTPTSPRPTTAAAASIS